MLDIFERSLWVIALITITILAGAFFVLGPPGSTAYVSMTAKPIAAKEFKDRVPKALKDRIEEVSFPKEADGKKSTKKHRGKSETRVINKPIVDRVSNINDAISEAQKGSSEVLQNKDGSTSLKIYDLKEDSLFKKVGLKNDDVINSINGTSIDFGDKLAARALFDDLKSQVDSGYPIVIQISRQGRPVRISLVLDEWLKKRK